tara:strand:+ start:301 stop:792 length:492 start_codon:yes stop_codon:yes gene_type:complete
MNAEKFKEYYNKCNKLQTEIKKEYGINVFILPYSISSTRLSMETLAKIAVEVINEHPNYEHINDIRDPSRKSVVKNVRHVFSYFATMFGYNRTEIGLFLDRDHSTVIHALKFCSDMMETNDIVIGDIINNINSKIKKHVENISDNFKAKVDSKSSYALVFNKE